MPLARAISTANVRRALAATRTSTEPAVCLLCNVETDLSQAGGGGQSPSSCMLVV